MSLKSVYLGLGSNLGDRTAHIEQALLHLEKAGVRLVRRSSFYETEPQDIRDQPWFLNIVAETETSLFPLQLLARIHQIESAMGRRRNIQKGPRTIDIDILLFGRFVMATEFLTIPHPGLAKRRFVLQPLAELAPDLRHPVICRPIRQLLGELQGQITKKIQVT
jgi:2-amino-4-hydroxy-6-hydroxymethyldihydropteridine diphosphokinase